MPRRSLLQGRVRAEIADAERRQLRPEDFGAAVLAALRLVVPYDDARLFGVDPGSLLLNRLIAASDTDGPFRAYWLRHLYLSQFSDAYFGPHELMRLGTRAISYQPQQDACWGMPEQLGDAMTPVEHARFFHESRTPVGGSLRLCLRARGQWIGMLDLVRREASLPISARDHAVCAEMVSLIGRGLDASLMREAADMRPTTGDDETGVVIVGNDRVIAYATPAGERYLASLPDVEQSRHGELATSLLTVMRALAHRDRLGQQPVIEVASRLGPLRIEATNGREPGSYAVVIAPVRRVARTTVPAHWPLTERQRQVAEQMLQGANTKAIARELFVSVPTVETHIGHIYEALGVTSRTELLARMFRETVLPRIDRNGCPVDHPEAGANGSPGQSRD